MSVKAIQLLVNESLPEDLRDYSRTYDKDSINELMTAVADRYPDRYAEIIDNIKDIGRHASYYQGETLRLNDFKPIIDKDIVLNQMYNEVAAAKLAIKDQKKRDQAIKDIYGKYAMLLEKLTVDQARYNHNNNKINNLYSTVVSGARGSNTQFKALVTTPGVYTDYKGDVIPLFVKKSFGEGLSLPEYLASTYGTRNSTVTIKRGTATGGFTGKQLARIMSKSVINKYKDLSDNGIDLDVDDESAYGRVLARPAGGYKEGTVINRDVLNDLRKRAADGKLSKTIIVHSPLATISQEGISAEAFGLGVNRRMPEIGDHVGMSAGTALGEPITQAALSSKHESGMFKGKKTFSGLDYIVQFLTSPEHFKNRAAVAEVEGKVDNIVDAPQGGKYIMINGVEHYVNPDTSIFVKKGDKVEQGDIISDGLADPEDITRLRGIGEGRKYVTLRFKDMLDASNSKASRRNLELFARAFVDDVRITDPDGLGDFLPDDIISYNALEANYVPEPDTKAYAVGDMAAKDKYLQKPVLHYTIGTKLFPSMIKHIKDSGITDKIYASETAPKFEPVFTRFQEAGVKSNKDFISRGAASYQKANYLDSAMRGLTSNIKTNYDPYVRMSQPDFADSIKLTGRF